MGRGGEMNQIGRLTEDETRKMEWLLKYRYVDNCVQRRYLEILLETTKLKAIHKLVLCDFIEEYDEEMDLKKQANWFHNKE